VYAQVHDSVGNIPSTSKYVAYKPSSENYYGESKPPSENYYGESKPPSENYYENMANLKNNVDTMIKNIENVNKNIELSINACENNKLECTQFLHARTSLNRAKTLIKKQAINSGINNYQKLPTQNKRRNNGRNNGRNNDIYMEITNKEKPNSTNNIYNSVLTQNKRGFK
jgi:hypothetical protein